MLINYVQSCACPIQKSEIQFVHATKRRAFVYESLFLIIFIANRECRVRLLISIPYPRCLAQRVIRTLLGIVRLRAIKKLTGGRYLLRVHTRPSR